jgi:hypothetical protein
VRVQPAGSHVDTGSNAAHLHIDARQVQPVLSRVAPQPAGCRRGSVGFAGGCNGDTDDSLRLYGSARIIRVGAKRSDRVRGYAITSGEQNLLEPQELTLTRDYTYDATLVLGKAREEQLMRDAIVDDLVRVVLKQISAI